jgi:hypothetical protein
MGYKKAELLTFGEIDDIVDLIMGIVNGRKMICYY